MRSLFVRMFLALWLTTTLVGVAFSVIHANSFPAEKIERWRRLVAETVRLHGQQSLRCLETASRQRCEQEMVQLSRETDLTLYLLRGDEVALAAVDVPPMARLVAAEAAAKGSEARSDSREGSFLALNVTGPGSERYVVVGRRPHVSRWDRAISPQTLPHRLLVLMVVTGGASYLLARYLTRPLRTLRHATQRIADGDYAVRVSPEIGESVGEVASLARDFDRMAQRIEALRTAEQRLLRDVSHELRSPLARLRVALEMARQRAGDGATKHLDRIEREAERLGDLIGQVLTVTRLEAELEEGPLAELDLTAILIDLVRDADFEARALGRRVELDAPLSVRMPGSEEILRSAIENVIRNAIRMTAEDTAVEVTLARDGPAGDRVALRIRDQGPGVPDSALSDIFRPFYRVGTDRDRRTGGSGIGLAITQRAVTLHGGSVTAENDPEGGLVVTLRFPATETHDAAPPTPEVEVPSQGVGGEAEAIAGE